MTRVSILDCRQAIGIVEDHELYRFLRGDRKDRVDGVVVEYGGEKIVVDRTLRVEGQHWVCRGKRFPRKQRVALTEWAQQVIRKSGQRKWSRRRSKPPPSRKDTAAEKS